VTTAHAPNAIGSVVPVWGGGSGSAPGPGFNVKGVVFAFTQADLVAGVFTALHARNQAYVLSRVYDDLGVEVLPDDNTIIDANTLAVDLSSFTPIPGTWHLIVVG
jgi:hypothetical protein